MEKNYYISGYTGFCPDMAHRVGQNYTDSTREALRERPHLRGRLGAMRWHDIENGNVVYRNGDGYECAYNAMPDYTPGYTGHIPTNLWTSCETDNQRYEDARCPLKAYPLSCSEYGSPCLDKRCDDEYSLCSRQNRGYNGNMFLSSVSHADFHPSPYQKGKQSSKPCGSSCSKGGSCESDRRSHYQAAKQSSKPCCDPSSKGRPCESDQRSHFQPKIQSSKACCSSCSKGGSCEEERTSYYRSLKQPSKACCASCAKGGSCEGGQRNEASRPSCCRFKYREVEVTPYRKCGVIPNYMGYIPGMQMTFGEPYGITANRLLRRHFNEQENRRF